MYQALIRLPSGKSQLDIESYGGWQGVFQIFWAEPQGFSADEQELYKTLRTALSMQIGGLLSQKRLNSAVGDLELLQQLGRQLNLALSFEEVLRVLLSQAPAPEEAEVALCAIDNDASGQPEWLTVLSQFNPQGNPTAPQVGVRYHVPEIPFAKLYLSSPDAPILVDDVNTDPRIDDHSRALYALSSVRATIVVALTIRDRWVGLLNLTWQRPVTFSARDMHIYQALAQHVGLSLDHSLVVERLRASLAQMNQQRSVLRTVLDHVPVGILLTEARIKAEVAQTMVALGIGLTGIATRSTLQSGIQYALQQLGPRI